MPISSDIVGRSGEPLTHVIDARWTMAHAASLEDVTPSFVDTRLRPDVLAHPLFPVCFEWPVFLDSRYLPTDVPPVDLLRGVHVTHDLILHRPIRAGMKVTTRATIVKIEGHRSGAYQVTRLVTTGSDGEPVSTTWFGMVYRGLDVEGGDRSLEDAGPALEPSDVGEPSEHFTIPISAGAALVYTECARIWNPIHTDAAVAAAAGLPGPILQGTATLARAVSRVVDERFDGDAERVTRIAGRFGAMVLMPSTLTLRVGAVVDHSVRFEVRDSGGNRAIRDGLLTVRTS